MAIYKNREVSVVSTHLQINRAPDLLTVSHKDGTLENVPFSQVAFTKAEKEAFIKANPNHFETAKEISDEDVQAVRMGVTPPSDPILKTQAETHVRHQRQQEEVKKNMDKAKAEADKHIQEETKRQESIKPAPVQTQPETKTDHSHRWTI